MGLEVTSTDTEPVVVDLGATDTTGPAGVVWSLPHGGDLDANLVHLDPGGAIPPHVNREVDVIISVVGGRGHLVVDGTSHLLHSDVLAVIPKGTCREIRADHRGLTYLSVHRRRSPLAIAPGAAGTQVTATGTADNTDGGGR